MARIHSGVVRIQDPRILCRQFLHRLGWAFGMPDKSVTDTAEDAHRKPTAAMWDRKKNDPINSGLMPEKEISQDQILFAC